MIPIVCLIIILSSIFAGLAVVRNLEESFKDNFITFVLHFIMYFAIFTCGAIFTKEIL